jgi:hypothetical protein
VWTLGAAVRNAAALLVMVAGAAGATLMLARRAGNPLSSGNEVGILGEGSLQETRAPREHAKVPRLQH